MIGQCRLAGWHRVVARRAPPDSGERTGQFTIGGYSGAEAPPEVDRDSVIGLGVEGMRCRDCPLVVSLTMLMVPGVMEVEVDYDRRRARVTCDEGAPDPTEAICVALEAAGYRCRRSTAP